MDLDFGIGTKRPLDIFTYNLPQKKQTVMPHFFTDYQRSEQVRCIVEGAFSLFFSDPKEDCKTVLEVIVNALYYVDKVGKNSPGGPLPVPIALACLIISSQTLCDYMCNTNLSNIVGNLFKRTKMNADIISIRDAQGWVLKKLDWDPWIKKHFFEIEGELERKSLMDLGELTNYCLYPPCLVNYKKCDISTWKLHIESDPVLERVSREITDFCKNPTNYRKMYYPWSCYLSIEEKNYTCKKFTLELDMLYKFLCSKPCTEALGKCRKLLEEFYSCYDTKKKSYTNMRCRSQPTENELELWLDSLTTIQKNGLMSKFTKRSLLAPRFSLHPKNLKLFCMKDNSLVNGFSIDSPYYKQLATTIFMYCDEPKKLHKAFLFHFEHMNMDERKLAKETLRKLENLWFSGSYVRS